VLIAADLQDPPELIGEMIRHWETGSQVVLGVKTSSDENSLMYWLRTKYYWLIKRFAELETYDHFTGFGLYDRKVVDIVREFADPYPYFRGIIAEIGMPHVELTYNQAQRRRGKSHNNFYTLYDLAMLGITNYSRVPLRIATFTGFVCSLLAVLIAAAYLVYKLLFWDRFSVGMAPLVIGAFFFASVQLVFLGILGEYIGSILTVVQHRPLVIERERINSEYEPAEPAVVPRAVL
jgi:hypothetical protein